MALAVCASLALPAAAITVGALQQQLAAGTALTLVDVRLATLYDQGHIPGAINIPASLCSARNLPALGRVIVYDDGLGHRGGTDAANGAAALNQKPGVTAEVLSGGYTGWLSAHGQSTAPSGLRPETINHVSYADLQAMNPADVVLVDLRKMNKTLMKTSSSLTDLSREFPGRRIRRDLVTQENVSGEPPLLILIDSADGTAEASARLLKAKGIQRYAVLLGGELTIVRKGKPGLERTGAVHRGSMPIPTAPSTGQPSQ
jgi:rhodanese-related sulfurtransferase